MLERILEQTREEVARRRGRVSETDLLRRISPSDRHFAAALRGTGTGFILECKRSSPSQGRLRDPYDPHEIATAYAPFADAVSVLTNGPFFGGALEHLRIVRDQVPCPVLCKDFIVEPFQILEARAAGADAALLMLSVLDDPGYADCRAAAHDAGIGTLTEVHSDQELDRALKLNAPVIGINNRDLKTLTVDTTTTSRLAPRIPGDRVVVCESGMQTHDDIRLLRPHVDAFLVGTSLMREPDLPPAVRRLIHGHTKVCGLTRVEDARAAWRAGATHGGLIFAPESPRLVTETQAEELVRSAPLGWVGVFVNQSPERIGMLAVKLGLGAVQLHGEESPEMVKALRDHLPTGCEVWKAVRVRESVPPPGSFHEDRLLLDTWSEGRRGGTGVRFDWSLLAGYPARDRLILGGGLTPENAVEADALGVWGLDVNSGVEIEPGIKSEERIRAFLSVRRGLGRRSGR